ncbi:MAG TPA: choice-of-anchor D domain-containing protein, partial [Acidimicrobiales bacterium]|nr:choice-of-anchor D domain-containing protein [Acidimicrobiales bacterium]
TVVARASERPAWTWIAIYGEPLAPAAPSQLFQQSASTPIQAYGSPNGVSFTVRGTPSFSIGFSPIKGNVLADGSYTDAEGPLGNTPRPGLALSFNGNACESTNLGSFVVSDIAFVNGIISRFDATFIEHCYGGPRAVFGEVQYNEAPTGALVLQASSLVFPAKYVGLANVGVPVSVTNPSPVPIPVGPVTTSGSASGDVAISGDNCPPLLGPGATCVITATVTPGAAGTRQAVINVGSGVGSSSVAVTDTGIAGNAAFALDSAPSEPIGEGQLWNFNQANADVVGSGTPSSVLISAYRDAQLAFQASFTAPVGQPLAVGDYFNAGVATATQAGLQITRSIVWSNSYYCDDFTGQFTIREIAFNGQGDLVRFAADAQGQCFSGGPNLFATVRLASANGYSALALQPAPRTNAPPLSFDPQVLGRTSPPQQVTVTNTGVVPLVVSPTITGANAADFQVVASTCAPSQPVAPGATCSASVAFSPVATGARQATLTLTNSTPRGQHVVALTGIANPVPTLTYPVDQQYGIDTTRLFTWVTSPAAQANRLLVSTTPDADYLVDSGVLPASTTSYPVPALPAYRTLYATLLTEVNGRWTPPQPITFTVSPQVAAFTYPVDGTLNSSATQPFSWSVKNQAQAYRLVVGTSSGAADLGDSGVLPPTQGSYSPPPLPANTILYATLSTEWVGTWISSN